MKKKLIFLAMLMIAVFNYSILISQTKNVLVDQKSFDNVSIDSVGWYNLSQNKFDKYLAPKSFNWNIGSTQTLLGSQKLIYNQKYKHWENNFNPDNNVVNHKSFGIQPNTDNLTSQFQPTNPGITIKTSLEGLDLTGGEVIFKDPWFIDYQDTQYANQLRNRGMNEAYPRQRTSPFYPNASTTYEYGQTYKGVFLNQNPATTPTYYKVGVPQEQTISVHGQSRLFYPYYWTGNGVSYDYPNYDTTGVVFTSSNATATAVLKGHLMSSDVNGISSNSQRKLVQIGPANILVYESMDKVWCSFFGDEDSPSEIFLKSNAKNPSIDYYEGYCIDSI